MLQCSDKLKFQYEETIKDEHTYNSIRMITIKQKNMRTNKKQKRDKYKRQLMRQLRRTLCGPRPVRTVFEKTHSPPQPGYARTTQAWWGFGKRDD